MILKKPYAFLIKHFKLIHAIILLLMIYLAYRTSMIISFFNGYINTLQLNTKVGIIDSLYNTLMFIVPVLIIMALIILITVMIIKDKPKNYYIFNIIAYIGIIIIYNISRNVISNMEVQVVDIRTVQLTRDFTLIAMFFQLLSIVLTFVRATGFDIKRFDFVEDLQNLDISEEDSEEFELELKFGTDRKLRNLRKFIRYAKYFYVENRFLVIIITLLFVGGNSLLIYKKLGMYEKIYKENNTLEVNGAYIKVERSYITNQNYKSKIIDDSKDYIILNMYSRLTYENSNPNFSSRAGLKIGEHIFYPTTSYKNAFYDLGIDYSDQTLDLDFKRFLLVYEIPDQISEKDMYFIYTDTNNKNVTIKLEPQSISMSESEVISNLTETMSFKDSTIGNINLTINSIEVSPKFKLSYNFCIKTNECMESYEYIYPKLNGAYDKALLKMNARIDYDEEYALTKNFIEFLKKFGVINYKINNTTYTNKVEISQIRATKSTTTDYYIEVENSLLQAENIYIEFNIRNKKYIYNLK